MMILILLGVLYVSGIYSIYLWAINLHVAFQEIWGVNLPIPIIGSYIPYLASVDISTVTTFVLMLTLYKITNGVQEIYRQLKKGQSIKDIWKEHFPFDPDYKAFLVQLGLLGTIFAFIVAFGKMSSSITLNYNQNPKEQPSIQFDHKKTSKDISSETTSEYDPRILIVPLGTALWSTFSGIFLAFVICPKIEGLFRRKMGVPPPSKDIDKALDNIGQEFETFGTRIGKAVSALNGVDEKIVSLNTKLTQLDGKMVNNTFESLIEMTGKIDGSLSTLNESVNKLKGILDKTEQAVDKFPEQVEKAMASLREEIENQKKTIDGLNRTMSDLKTEIGDNSAALSKASERMTKLNIGVCGSKKEIKNLTGVLNRVFDEIKNLKSAQNAISQLILLQQEEMDGVKKTEANYQQRIEKLLEKKVSLAKHPTFWERLKKWLRW